VAELPLEANDPRVAFIEAATWHGDLEPAEAILAAHPEVASLDIHTAAILGDDAGVRGFLQREPEAATATSAPYGGDALVHLCLSKYLRLDATRSEGFLRAATALLDAGADPNTGFWTTGKFPEFETALYGAAGVAHHPEMTRLLLERGADPNDVEAVYHSPETRNNGAMMLLVETGRITADNLSLMLIRKHDWHDYHGAKYLLEHGANPNGVRSRGWLPMHHALARDNALSMFELLLDHNADPTAVNDGLSAIARAAREGRSDVLELFRQRGIPIELHGVDRLIAACAMGDAPAVRSIADREPDLVAEVLKVGGTLLAKFSGTDNPAGVRQLLDLGVDVAAPFTEGDGYFGIPANSLAIHVAAWRAHPEVVKLLIERGSGVDEPDANGRTPLALAVRACVDSYWTEMRSPESVEALLAAGASVRGIDFPSGYEAVDELLRQHAGGT
jgi:ankyrin repeat protein